MKPASTCLIIAEDSPESYSPAGERLRHMASASSKFFSRTIVLTMGRPRRQSATSFAPEFSLHTTGLTRAMPFPISALFDPMKFLAFFFYGLALCGLYNPSLIAASMPPIETGVSGLFLTMFLRKKLLIDYMDDWESAMKSQLSGYVPEVLMKPTTKFAKRIYSSSVAIFVATQTLARTIRQYGARAMVILAPNGADSLIFLPRDGGHRREMRLKCALPLDKTVVAYCGSGINPYYRIDLILLAAKSLPLAARKKISFVFYLYTGVEYCRRLKSALELSDDLVEIRAPLQRSDLSEVMAACDIGLVPFDDNPYLLYAMSTKVYEYLSAGLYVVGSGPCGGELDSFFSQNINCGVFVEPKVENFVDVFLEIMENNALFLGDSSRKLRHSFVIENYDSRTIMQKAMKQLSSLEQIKSE
jgi:glycosyltransferase involved in cell wall biosynthesis